MHGLEGQQAVVDPLGGVSAAVGATGTCGVGELPGWPSWGVVTSDFCRSRRLPNDAGESSVTAREDAVAVLSLPSVIVDDDS